VKPFSPRLPNTPNFLPVPAILVSSSRLPSTVTKKSTLPKLCRTSRLRCAGRTVDTGGAAGAGVTSAEAGGAAGTGITPGAGAGVTADQFGIAIAARSSAAPENCAINGRRARIGSHRGQINFSHRRPDSSGLTSGFSDTP
jgi:hypothetical protein